MKFPAQGVRRDVRRFANLLTPAAFAFMAACSSGEDSPQSPVLPPNPPSNPQLRQAAFIFDVDVRNKSVKVSEPTTGLQNLSVIGGFEGGADYSIIGGDVLEVSTAGFAITAGGGFPSGAIATGPCPGGSPAAVPGRLCVEFDVNVFNELAGVQLVGPQIFPAPPPGTTGPLLFPFDIAVTTTGGGVGQGSGPQGNDVIVETPSSGEVTVNEEWAGSPFNFFNDTACPATPQSGTAQGSSDCFRWEEITPTPLGPNGTSAANRVGFYLDPTVGTFRVRFLVAADLQNGTAQNGSVAGTVTSPQLGALSGVVVTVTNSGTQTSSATGAYSFATVGTGPKTVEITSGLPAGCSAPASQGITVQANQTSTVNFSVTCPVPVGTISGTITSSLGGGIAGASVTVTPAGLSALAPVTTSAAGDYSRTSVPLGTPTGTGSIALAGLPAGCTNPGPQAYSGLTANGTLDIDITVTCVAAPASYVLRGTWSGTAGNRTYTLTYDLTGRDDPAIPGVDDVFVISGTTTFGNLAASGLAFANSSSNVAGSLLQNQGSNLVAPGQVAWLNFDTDVARAIGNVGVINLLFTGTPVAGQTITPSTSFGVTDDVQSENGTDLKPNTTFSEASLSL